MAKLLEQLFRTDVVVVTIQLPQSPVGMATCAVSPCTSSRNNQLTGPAFKVGTFQVTVGYTGPVGKLVV